MMAPGTPRTVRLGTLAIPMSALSTIGTLGDCFQSHNQNLRLAFGASGFVSHREATGELSIFAVRSFLVAKS